MFTIAHSATYAVLDKGLALITFIVWNAIVVWGSNQCLTSAGRKA